NTPSGPRIIMLNGDRQQYDPQTRKLSILTFKRYTLDLDALQDAPVVRFREAPERFLPDLFFPPKSLDRDPFLRHTFIMEAQQRVLVPLSAFSFALIPLACLLPGQFNRRGQLRRGILTLIAAFVFQTIALGVNDLANRFAAMIPLMYVVELLPFAIGIAILLPRGRRFGWRWPRLAESRG
ncbi:MAG TPA: LptF/LptG family permease, partial [Stellaceae bacterium]|nr:LptF/LptG family permease [Stellaceae bacterium]